MVSGIVRVALVAGVVGCVALSRVHAQATLTTSATALSIPAPTATEYNASYSLIGSLSFSAANCPTTGTGCSVTIIATNAVIGSQPIEHVEWQLNSTAAGGWHTMSAAVPAEVVAVARGGSASGTIYFRVLLSWSNDTADQLYQAGIRLAVSQR